MTTIAKGLSSNLTEAEKIKERKNIGIEITESSTDTTEGRLLKVGDFGLGSNVSIPLGGGFDLNNVPRVSGFYAGYNAINAPESGIFTLIVTNYSNDWTTQEFVKLGAVSLKYIRAFYNGTTWSDWQKIYHSGNDGADSGLDADTVDGLQASQFLRSDTSDTMTGTLTVNGALNGTAVTQSTTDTTAGRLLKVGDFGVGDPINLNSSDDLDTIITPGIYSWNAGSVPLNAPESYGIIMVADDESQPSQVMLAGGANGGLYQRRRNSGVWTGWVEFYHTGNGGSGSGLDADLLDGLQGSQYLRSDTSDTFTGTLTVNGAVDGTAVTQNATDTTEGRLLKVGDFGVGSLTAPSITDLDTTVVQGFYGCSGLATGIPAGEQGGVLSVYSQSSGRVLQVFHPHDKNKMFIRYKSELVAGGAWQPWQEIYHQGNILGIVSQSGGVPTGAIIERGSNANGEYVKFADGTMICAIISSTLSSGDRVWTFPSAFSYQPSGLIATARTGLAGNVSVFFRNDATTTQASYVGYNSSDVMVAVTCSLAAIGRWF